MKRIILLVTVVLLVPQVAWASTFAVGPTVQVSGASPFDANCGLAGQSGTNYPNSEVEPYVDVNPSERGQPHRRVAAGPLVERWFARQRGGSEPR